MFSFATLGFFPIKEIKNQYGICVHTSDNDNGWAYYIPAYLCKAKYKDMRRKCCKEGLVFFDITKEHTYQKVKEWTEFAEQYFESMKG